LPVIPKAKETEKNVSSLILGWQFQ